MKRLCVGIGLAVLMMVSGCGKGEGNGTRGAASQAPGGPTVEAGGAWRAGTPMPIYVTPLYDYRGPQIHVGAFSKELAAASADTIKDVAAAMKKEWERLPIEAMYVAAIRHYDLGRKDEAVYWFYSAQYRARLFKAILAEPPASSGGGSMREETAAQVAFNQLAGEFINGYAFGDLQKLKATLETVRADGEKSLPQFAAIYPTAHFIADSAWREKDQANAAGLSKLVDMIVQQGDEIKAARKKNGVEGKY